MPILDSGECVMVAELAKALRVNPPHQSRILRLNLLAPDIVEAILDVTQAAGVTMARLMAPMRAEWERQRLAFQLLQ